MIRVGAVVLGLAALAACARPAPVYHAGALTISGVYAPEPVRGGPGGAYFTIANAGDPDTLMAVTSPDADSVSMHGTVDRDGTALMGPLAAVAILTGDTIRFAPGHDHVMLERLRRPIAAGDSVPLVLHFRHAGAVAVAARVVSYQDLESALDRH